MKLTAPSYLILGMVRLGVRSGYGIKKAADISTKHFWPMSLATVYPELASLEDGGLISRRDDPYGARSRHSYELTEDGEQALLAWLRASRDAPPQLRDERLLRLFFADALPRDDQLALLRRLRESDETASAWIRREILPLAGAKEPADRRFPVAVARLSADLYSFVAQWLVDFEAELAAESRSSDEAG